MKRPLVLSFAVLLAIMLPLAVSPAFGAADSRGDHHGGVALGHSDYHLNYHGGFGPWHSNDWHYGWRSYGADGWLPFAFVTGAVIGASIIESECTPPPVVVYPAPASVVVYQQPIPAPAPVVVLPTPTTSSANVVVLGTVQPLPTATGPVKLIFPTREPCQIDIPQGKLIHPGDSLIYVRNGKSIGEFKVVAIDGQNVTLQLLWGQEPTNGDGFAICPH